MLAGGFGGLGQVIAEWLGKRAGNVLALLGRSGASEETEQLLRGAGGCLCGRVDVGEREGINLVSG